MMTAVEDAAGAGAAGPAPGWDEARRALVSAAGMACEAVTGLAEETSGERAVRVARQAVKVLEAAAAQVTRAAWDEALIEQREARAYSAGFAAGQASARARRRAARPGSLPGAVIPLPR